MVVDQEVYTEYQNVRVAQDKIALAQKSADEAKKNLAFAEGRYSARAGNVIELTDAELLAATTQSLVEARYAYQVLSAGCRWLARRIRSIRKGGRTAS